MTINKYFVLVPQDANNEAHKEQNNQSEKETQRQAIVKAAQEEGGL
ncbi:hypothetical protein L4D20_05915 [Vibrio kyushuensis]